MKNSIKLLKLDFLSIKPYLTLKNFIIAFAAMVFYVYYPQTPYISVVPLFAAIYVSYPFLVGVDSGIDTLYRMLGISPNAVVKGRYMFAMIGNFTVSLLFLISLIISSLIKKNADMLSCLTLSSVAFLGAVLVSFVQIPPLFKYGYQKGRQVYAMTAGAAVLAVIAVEKLVPFIPKSELLIGIIVVTAVLLLALVSYKLSIKFYNKREF